MSQDFIEVVATLVIIAAWGLRSIVGPLLKKQAQQKASGPPQRAAAADRERTVEAPKRSRTAELMRELGLDPEELRPVLPESVSSKAPPVPLPPVPVTAVSRWESRKSAMDKAPPSLIVPDESHSLLEPPPPLGGDGPTLRRWRPAGDLAVEVLDDLRGGAESLSRAILLSEILGPPVALRPPDESQG